MIEGTLIAESRRVGTNLENLEPVSRGEPRDLPGPDPPLPEGDEAGRAEAQAHGRQPAIPEPRPDWTA